MNAAVDTLHWTDDVLESFNAGERLRRMTISHATDLWIGELARQSKSARTRDTYRRLLDKLSETYPHDDVDDISPAKCRRFLDRWQHCSPATIAQNVSILNGFFGWLEGEGLVKRTPMERILRPILPSPDENDSVTTVSAADVGKLLAAADASGRWDRRLAVYCLVYLGPRRHAIARVRLSDYDQVERKLTFREKGGKTIRKPVPHELADLLDAAIVAGVYGSSDDYLIPSRAEQRRKGDRDDRVIWRLVREVAADAGVTTHVHALRAAFAVQFLQQHPGEVVALKKLMGHSRLDTTMVYLRRLTRGEEMETVRDLSWSVLPQSAGIELESSHGAEKEGFEPSFEPMRLLDRVRAQHEAVAPRETT